MPLFNQLIIKDDPSETSTQVPHKNATKTLPSQVNYDVQVTDLYILIEQQKWSAVIERIHQFSYEAKTWVIRVDQKTNKLRWRMLPLHAAILFNAPEEVITYLIQAYPDAVKMGDDRQMLPLHLAFRNNNTSEKVMNELLKGYPDAVSMKDLEGRLPVNLAATNNHHAVNFMRLHFTTEMNRRTTENMEISQLCAEQKLRILDLEENLNRNARQALEEVRTPPNTEERDVHSDENNALVIKISEQERQNYKDIIDELTKRCEQKKNLLLENEREQKGIEAKLAESEKSKRNAEALMNVLSETVESQREELYKYHVETSQMETKIKNSEQEKQSLLDKNDMYKVTLGAMKLQLREFDQKITELITENETLKAEISASIGEHKTIQEDLLKNNKKLAAERNELEKSITDLESKNAEQAKEIGKMVAFTEELRCSNKNSEAKIANLEESLQNSLTCSMDLMSQAGDVSEVKDRNEYLDVEVQRLNDELSDYKEKMDDLILQSEEERLLHRNKIEKVENELSTTFNVASEIAERMQNLQANEVALVDQITYLEDEGVRCLSIINDLNYAIAQKGEVANFGFERETESLFDALSTTTLYVEMTLDRKEALEKEIQRKELTIKKMRENSVSKMKNTVATLDNENEDMKGTIVRLEDVIVSSQKKLAHQQLCLDTGNEHRSLSKSRSSSSLFRERIL